MGWRVGKQSHKPKTSKSKPKISGWEQLGLTAPKERREVPMEEIRRQGRILAGVGIGQSYRVPMSQSGSRALVKTVSGSKGAPVARRRASR